MPDHEPVDADRLSPDTAVPETTGAALFAGFVADAVGAWTVTVCAGKDVEPVKLSSAR